jgi:hypothetical protein
MVGDVELVGEQRRRKRGIETDQRQGAEAGRGRRNELVRISGGTEARGRIDNSRIEACACVTVSGAKQTGTATAKSVST